MCTLIIASAVWRETPLVVAANRDERLDRPAEGPSSWDNGGVRLLAPRDLEARGTWLGVNARGVFVAITNRFTPHLRSGVRSRGQLVLDALRESSAEAAATRVAAEDPGRHNPFHLVMADVHGAHLVWNDGQEHRRHRLEPGVHVVTERSMGAAPSARLQRLPELVRPLVQPALPPLSAWQRVLRHRDEPSLEGVNVHDEARNYGTRSSTIVHLARRPEASTFVHANGAPDQVPFEDVSAQLRALL